MRKYVLLVTVFLFFFPLLINAQSNTKTINKNHVDFPWVPRISAFEAYNKYKAGKALLLFGGGEDYNNRHIMGSLNLDFRPREKALMKFPRQGIELFTYCF